MGATHSTTQNYKALNISKIGYFVIILEFKRGACYLSIFKRHSNGIQTAFKRHSNTIQTLFKHYSNIKIICLMFEYQKKAIYLQYPKIQSYDYKDFFYNK